MAITYARLRELKVELGFNWMDLIGNKVCSSTVTANINKDRYIKLESIESIIEYLNNRYNLNLDIGDLVSIKR